MYSFCFVGVAQRLRIGSKNGCGVASVITCSVELTKFGHAGFRGMGGGRGSLFSRRHSIAPAYRYDRSTSPIEKPLISANDIDVTSWEAWIG
jgi:hypothetical protein